MNNMQQNLQHFKITNSAWQEAAEVVALLTGRLATDFLATRLPAVGILLGDAQWACGRRWCRCWC